MEGELANEQLSGLLELPDLTKSDSAWAESVRLLDTLVGDVGGLAGGLLSELLARRLRSRVLPSCLLCASHFLSVSFF